MIKPNELRIGNYVQWSDEPGVYEQWMHGHWLGTFNENYPFPEPIPLTSEWLLKFGFEEHPVSWSKDISYFPQSYKTICVTISQGIMLREGDGIQARSKDDLVVLWNTDVRGSIMVHNLQNIYYALTGEELTIQE